ncbi:hypothetical protein [Catenuloplanes japonicus]|uniref:hypothetical protein n=1 Tax=Catenuloplanes japonicus TaxID=33876 RepID=UPI000527C39D|nr:hypothetical protein [Catenuloplanes japonicus]
MENDAAAQLAAINDTRSAVADRLITPWWYHPALGTALAVYVVGLSLGNTAVRLATVAVFVAFCVVLTRTYRRMTGVWVSGADAKGVAGRWATAMGAMVGVIAIAGWLIGAYTDLDWPVWCLAVVVLAGTIVLGRRFDAALRAQLRAAA